MIMYGEVDGLSNRARKQVIRAVKSGAHEVMSLGGEQDQDVEISFGPKDKRALMIPHADALVCTVEIANCLVYRIFVDTGSAVNILYWDYLQAMGIEAKLRPASGPLYGFSGESVLLLGLIDLPLTLGSPGARKTRIVEFTVMDLPNVAYNGIMGRPALSAFRAVVSMYYLKIKFPAGKSVGEVYGNQGSSKECYVKAVSHRDTEKRSLALEDKNRKKRMRKAGTSVGEKLEVTEITDTITSEEKQPLVTTGDQCMNVELFPGKTRFATKIGADLQPNIREELIDCLRRNADVFAFSTTDLKGIDPKVAEHRLNEDPKVKPVKQRLRHFGA